MIRLGRSRAFQQSIVAIYWVALPLFRDDTEFYKQLVQNPGFRRFVADTVQKLTAGPAG